MREDVVRCGQSKDTRKDVELGWQGRSRLQGSPPSTAPHTTRHPCPYPPPPLRQLLRLALGHAAREAASTDLGTLGLVEWWAGDGRADEHGTQGCAAAVVAGAVCDPGCPGLEGTEVANGDLWPVALVN